jgi:hypothetical protein
MPLPAKFNGKAIYLPEISAGAATVSIDGRCLGTRVWGPYVFKTNRIQGKTLAITLTGNLGLLLKRRYGCSRYIGTPFGLLQNPRFF